ncbi:multiheme c-type cytochrome [Calditrichota bacterium]
MQKLLLTTLLALLPIGALASQQTYLTSISDETLACIECHKENTPGIYGQWGTSKHFGANVGCYECHQADSKDKDAFDHNGWDISILVTPMDCRKCHEQEVDQFVASHHATAGKILGSLDNTLGEVIEGPAAAVSGCKQCHGSEVVVLDDGKLHPDTWPNTGMGRINPDGSTGSCTACHSRHAFSAAQARQPENCGKCHLGPDHPQKEIYEESKHGIAYYNNMDKMNINNSKWIVGEDYNAAPTCATCHMSATRDLPLTHDVGDRISWTLRPAVSMKVDEVAKKQGKKVKSWEARRADMKNVCSACHTPDYIEAHFYQYDNLVELYNDKFAIPGKAIIASLNANGMITGDIAFDDKIEWTWFYLWHHEGRRARMGASMFAPDYTQWHGMFEVAERFYMELVPEARELAHEAEVAGRKKEAESVYAVIDEILEREEHRWFLGKMSEKEKKARQKAAEEFQKRYGK